MSSKVLIISSNIHQKLAKEQLELCLALVKNTGYEYEIELLEAGAYEIPFVIQAYHQKKPFDGYITLGLILNENLEHYQFIMNHVQYCFTQFSLKNIIIGNGIISGKTHEELSEKLRSSNPCLSLYPSAVNAVNFLIQLRQKITKSTV